MSNLMEALRNINMREKMDKTSDNCFKNIDGDNCHKDVDLTNLTNLEVKYLYVARNIDDFSRLSTYTAISPDPENFNRCVARERYLEAQSAKLAGKFLLYLTESDEIVDEEFSAVQTLNGNRILARCDGYKINKVIEKIIKMNGFPICSLEDNRKVKNWFKVYNTKRFLTITTLGDFRNNLKKYVDLYGSIFVKTIEKDSSAIVKNISDFLPYDDWSERPLIISEPINILSDELGKLEYRVFVFDNQIVSISRYLDYEKHEVPEVVFDFAKQVVETMCELDFPSSYVVDIMVYNENELDVVEFNPINSSGRYVQNTI